MKSNSTAWYKNGWVWLIIALPALTVVAGIATVVITSLNQPEMVVDDYYKKGKAINQELTLYQAYTDSGIQLDVRLEGQRFELKSSEVLSAIKINLVHSTQGKRDLNFVMTPNAVGTYTKTLDTALTGKWTVFVEPMDGTWKVQQKLAFPNSDWTKLVAE
ncbi:FixH family protein [Psychrosphaera sp.]|nr:FixH family protein [Psychrosphaera sp.]